MTQALTLYVTPTAGFRFSNGTRALCLAAVIAMHIGLVAFALVPSGPTTAPKELSVIRASIVSKAAQPAVTQEAKPLPAAVKPKIRPQRSMIAAPTPATEPVESAVVADLPPPADEGNEEKEAGIVEPSADADYLTNPAPEYPSASRRRGEQGKVVLRVFVEKNGKPSEVTLQASSGFDRLDKAALDAVRQWSFVPAKQGEDIVAAWVLVPVVFSLRG